MEPRIYKMPRLRTLLELDPSSRATAQISLTGRCPLSIMSDEDEDDDDDDDDDDDATFHIKFNDFDKPVWHVKK